MVKDIHPGNSTSGYPLSSSPSSFVTVGDTMYFTATGQFGQELYSSDGSTTGTQLVEDFNTVSPGLANSENFSSIDQIRIP